MSTPAPASYCFISVPVHWDATCEHHSQNTALIPALCSGWQSPHCPWYRIEEHEHKPGPLPATPQPELPEPSQWNFRVAVLDPFCKGLSQCNRTLQCSVHSLTQAEVSMELVDKACLSSIHNEHSREPVNWAGLPTGHILRVLWTSNGRKKTGQKTWRLRCWDDTVSPEDFPEGYLVNHKSSHMVVLAGVSDDFSDQNQCSHWLTGNFFKTSMNTPPFFIAFGILCLGITLFLDIPWILTLSLNNAQWASLQGYWPHPLQHFPFGSISWTVLI